MHTPETPMRIDKQVEKEYFAVYIGGISKKI